MPKIHPKQVESGEDAIEHGCDSGETANPSVGSSGSSQQFGRRYAATALMHRSDDGEDGGDGEDDGEAATESHLGCVVFLLSMVIGSIIYLPFLISVTIQSVVTRIPMDPAEWKERLSWQAWGAGFATAITMILGPICLVFVDPESDTWIILLLSFVGVTIGVQVLTVVYALMRPELRKTKTSERDVIFISGCGGCVEDSKVEETKMPKLHFDVDTPLPGLAPTIPMIREANLSLPLPPARDGSIGEYSKEEMENAMRRMMTRRRHQAPDEAALVKIADKERMRLLRRQPLITSPCWLGLWRNWLATAVMLFELLQMLTIAITSSRTLLSSLKMLLPDITMGIENTKDAVWSFGLTASTEQEQKQQSAVTAGIVGCAFTFIYAMLCGIAIALDIEPQSNFGPILFSLFAGGMFVVITSMLFFAAITSYSPAITIPSLIAFAYYSSTAVFVSTYRSDKTAVSRHEIRTIPAFLGGERILKGLLSVLFNYVLPSNQSIVVSVLLVILASATYTLKPMSNPVVNSIRSLKLGTAATIAVIGLVCDHFLPTPRIEIAILLLVVLVASFLLLCTYVCCDPVPRLLLRCRIESLSTMQLTRRERNNVAPILQGENTPPCFPCACCLPTGTVTLLEVDRYIRITERHVQGRRVSAFTGEVK